jgi:hypothetical protein
MSGVLLIFSDNGAKRQGQLELKGKKIRDLRIAAIKKAEG